MLFEQILMQKIMQKLMTYIVMVQAPCIKLFHESDHPSTWIVSLTLCKLKKHSLVTVRLVLGLICREGNWALSYAAKTWVTKGCVLQGDPTYI
jgi:hypothetical protein